MSDVLETNRWRGIVGVTLIAAAVGLLAQQEHLLLLAVIGVVFAAYPFVTRTPTITLDVERRMNNSSPVAGDLVTITVEVTNVGEDFLPDLRFVDGVPAVLEVVAGSPRRGIALAPGRSVTFSYTVRVQTGRHAFEPASVVARDVSGAREVSRTISTETTIDCSTSASAGMLREATLPITGQVRSNRPGAGTEFHQTRRYRHGDPVSRIDWNRYARTRRLTTVEYAKVQSTTVVIVVDARETAYRGSPGEPHAVALGVSAAGQLCRGLHGRNNRVGLAGIGRELCWEEPGLTAEHVEAIERLLASHETFASAPATETRNVQRQYTAIRDRLPANAEILLLSPICDDEIVDFALRLRDDGHPLTIFSPDVTSGDTTGQRLARVERNNRLGILRREETSVIDWSPRGDPAPMDVDDGRATV